MGYVKHFKLGEEKTDIQKMLVDLNKHLFISVQEWIALQSRKNDISERELFLATKDGVLAFAGNFLGSLLDNAIENDKANKIKFINSCETIFKKYIQDMKNNIK